MKTKKLRPSFIEELSVIFNEHKGSQWRPQNESATVIATKGGAVATEEKPMNFLERFTAELKKGWMVRDDQPDTIDGDGDGAEDYEQLARIFMSAYYDISTATGLSGETARSAAIVAAVDTALANIDDVREGGDGTVAKAGRRHSAATRDKLKSVREKLASLATDLEALENEGVEKKGAEDEEQDDPGEKPAENETIESLEAAADAHVAEEGTK